MEAQNQENIRDYYTIAIYYLTKNLLIYCILIRRMKYNRGEERGK